jgi:hypothetical protein
VDRPRSRVRISFTPDGEVEEFWLASCDATLELDRRCWQALMLAPTLAVCRALLRGEHVPRSALRPEWVSRFYLRSSS